MAPNNIEKPALVCYCPSTHLLRVNGEGGIRTHGCLTTTPLFESGTINHSDTSPKLGIILINQEDV